MGQSVTKFAENCSNVASVVNLLNGSRHRKRKRRPEDDLPSSDTESNESLSPKKKKLLTTTQYIYKELFQEQKNSDIAILALGKVWNLHKVYLSQSPYFYSMFNGSWRESCEKFVHIKILDKRITLEALDAVFGSLYSDEIDIEQPMCVSILATATLFHLEGIIEKCTEVMIDTINPETVILYYETARQYGCQNVKSAAFHWLEINLLCIYNKYPGLLRSISVDLMTKIISSPDLYVMQTEFSLYTLLRIWIYLRLHPSYNPQTTYELQPKQMEQQNRMIEQQTQRGQETFSSKSDTNISQRSIVGLSIDAGTTPTSPTDLINTYFSAQQEDRYNRPLHVHHYNELHYTDCNCCFLCKPQGKQFVKPFQVLRTQYLTNHHTDLKVILNDNIIPKEWVHKHVLGHWKSILKVDHLSEEGVQDIDVETFQKYAMRCGRLLLENGYSKWRWTGFHFGLDLILIIDGRVLSIRRHHRNEHERLLTLQTKRRFMIRISVSSINSQRQPIFTQKTDIMSLCLEKNEEVSLMMLEPQLVHPLLVSVNLLVVSPTPQRFKENINIDMISDELNGTSIPISDIGENSQRPTTPIEEQPCCSSDCLSKGNAIMSKSSVIITNDGDIITNGSINTTKGSTHIINTTTNTYANEMCGECTTRCLPSSSSVHSHLSATAPVSLSVMQRSNSIVSTVSRESSGSSRSSSMSPSSHNGCM